MHKLLTVYSWLYALLHSQMTLSQDTVSLLTNQDNHYISNTKGLF